MRNFKELTIWQNSIKIVKAIYRHCNSLPNEEKYGLKSQIQRASISIPSNIAEGCSRSSELEFKHYLEIALGSAFEVETQLIIIQELNMIQENELLETFDELNKLQKMLNNFIGKIKQNTENPKPKS
jgi:four helix bundle protein